MDDEEFLHLCETTNKRSHGELVARLIIDSKTGIIFYVPSEMNHLPYLAKHILKISEESLKSQPEVASPFVSAVIKFSGDKIQEILTGVSGLETSLKVFKEPVHKKEEVNAAHAFLLDFLVRINAVFAPGFKDRVVYL